MPEKNVSIGHVWTVEEPFIIPYYHDTVRLAFKSKFTSLQNRGRKLLAIIDVSISMSEREKKLRAARMNETVEYDIKGRAKIEFDQLKGRVIGIHLVVNVGFEGEIPNPSADSEGDVSVKGIITYEEMQTLKTK